MPGFLLPLIGGLLSAGAGYLSYKGQKETNAENARLAREQMSFQERMSSTAAQRSVVDYAASGLNPALAYDRPASSPSGAMSRSEDAVTKGISSAMQAKALQQSLRIAAAQSQADLELKQSQTLRNAAEGATSIRQGDVLSSQQRINDQLISFRGIDQPFETRSRAARALVDEYAVPAARNVADMERRYGALSPELRFWLNNARTAAGALSPLNLFDPRWRDR